MHSKIGGTDGHEDGKIIGKKILQILFTKKVLTNFSWTGISRTKNVEKKIPFQGNTNILKFFLNVLLQADSRWNTEKNEKFFKSNILKHAIQSNAAFEKKKNVDKNTNEDLDDDLPVSSSIDEVNSKNNDEIVENVKENNQN